MYELIGQNNKITKARITALPESAGQGPCARIDVTVEGYGTQLLSVYYTDELDFEPEQFIGQTLDGALRILHLEEAQFLRVLLETVRPGLLRPQPHIACGPPSFTVGDVLRLKTDLL
jgi:hypothetical protein